MLQKHCIALGGSYQGAGQTTTRHAKTSHDAVAPHEEMADLPEQKLEPDTSSTQSSGQSSRTTISHSSCRTGSRSRSGGRGSSVVRGATSCLILSALQRKRAAKKRDSASADPDDLARQEIEEVIDECIARHRDQGLSASAAYSRVEFEGKKVQRSAQTVLDRDEEAIAHNRIMMRREKYFSLTGVFCLAFPILLIFDSLSFLLPQNYIDVLSNGAQEESAFGKMALLTISIVDMAMTARELNDGSNGAYIGTCFISLCTLLGLVRKFARRKRTISRVQRQRMLAMIKTISDHLDRRRPDIPQVSETEPQADQSASPNGPSRD